MAADWRVGAGADLERAPLSPVRVLDAREFPEFVGGGPDVQFPRLALELDQSGLPASLRASTVTSTMA